jgi:two-component system cell cycle sensor histidine kinase/response regulator CckA
MTTLSSISNRDAHTRLRGLVKLGLELARERDAERLPPTLCVAARELFGATYVTLGILDQQSQTVSRVFSCDSHDACATGAPTWIQPGDAVPGILATVVGEGRTLLGHNIGGDPAALRLPPLHPEISCYLAAPMASPEHVYGWICLVSNGGIAFSEDDEHLLTTLAGQVGRIYALEQEIIERKQAESLLRVEREALRTSEERVRFALEAANVGVWDLDFATGVLQWSAILESHYGLQPGTFAGTPAAFLDGVHPLDREAVRDAMAHASQSGVDFSVQHRALWPDGSVRWLSGAGRIHLDAQGTPVRGIGISMDITERRRLEDQYQQASKMETIGRLAGGVAHDFNNLLTVILGYCGIVLDELDAADPHRVEIGEIQRAGVRAAGLTRQLLAFSRKQIIELVVLDLNQVVVEMRVMLGRLIGEDVAIVLVLGPTPVLLKADRGEVEQIVVNLAVNARDAMPKGGTLTIEVARVDPDVVLTVSDTGTGMSAEVQARLFEPFFTTKDVGKGTGIGLATVQSIVSRGGGSIGVSSELGHGTSLKVRFPQSGAAELTVPVAPTTPRPHTATQTVLVVEDADTVRDLARTLLQRQGYTVLVAAHADEAMRLCEQPGPIDVLLTDVVMPGASGPDLTQALVKKRPGLKVIYMSGYTEDAIVHHGVLKPGIAFLHKPFTSETLGLKIREAVDRG